jgi:hypothetical protein
MFNMSYAIDEFIKEERRSVIRFLWSVSVKTAEIYEKLQRKLYEWVGRFKEWRTSVVDVARKAIT